MVRNSLLILLTLLLAMTNLASAETKWSLSDLWEVLKENNPEYLRAANRYRQQKDNLIHDEMILPTVLIDIIPVQYDLLAGDLVNELRLTTPRNFSLDLGRGLTLTSGGSLNFALGGTWGINYSLSLNYLFWEPASFEEKKFSKELLEIELAFLTTKQNLFLNLLELYHRLCLITDQIEAAQLSLFIAQQEYHYQTKLLGLDLIDEAELIMTEQALQNSEQALENLLLVQDNLWLELSLLLGDLTFDAVEILPFPALELQIIAGDLAYETALAKRLDYQINLLTLKLLEGELEELSNKNPFDGQVSLAYTYSDLGGHSLKMGVNIRGLFGDDSADKIKQQKEYELIILQKELPLNEKRLELSLARTYFDLLQQQDQLQIIKGDLQQKDLEMQAIESMFEKGFKSQHQLDLIRLAFLQAKNLYQEHQLSLVRGILKYYQLQGYNILELISF